MLVMTTISGPNQPGLVHLGRWMNDAFRRDSLYHGGGDQAVSNYFASSMICVERVLKIPIRTPFGC